ncbi:MAG: hypothetical protein M3066_06390, partial [Actinomycetota bacterium]|nr:hypothetical protein [Actinomycetota bacterium]
MADMSPLSDDISALWGSQEHRPLDPDLATTPPRRQERRPPPRPEEADRPEVLEAQLREDLDRLTTAVERQRAESAQTLAEELARIRSEVAEEAHRRIRDVETMQTGRLDAMAEQLAAALSAGAGARTAHGIETRRRGDLEDRFREDLAQVKAAVEDLASRQASGAEVEALRAELDTSLTHAIEQIRSDTATVGSRLAEAVDRFPLLERNMRELAKAAQERGDELAVIRAELDGPIALNIDRARAETAATDARISQIQHWMEDQVAAVADRVAATASTAAVLQSTVHVGAERMDRLEQKADDQRVWLAEYCERTVAATEVRLAGAEADARRQFERTADWQSQSAAAEAAAGERLAALEDHVRDLAGI